jgi:translation initiation factor IF-2
VGDVVAAGASLGKVRSLSNAAGASITEAGPSIAVQMVGLNNVPQAGDEFKVYSSDADARAASEAAEAGLRQARLADMTASGSMVTLSRCGAAGGGVLGG